MNISTYMGDAQTMELPLVGGGDHDWNLLFGQWGVLTHATQYAQLAHGFGFLVMLVATYWGIAEVLGSAARHAIAPTRYRSMARR